MLLTSDSGEFTLTSHRARYVSGGLGGGEVVSIMLESVTSCRAVRLSKPWFLVAAAVAVAVGVAGAAYESEPLALGFFVAVVAVGLYLGSRQRVIMITSPTAEIRLKTRGMPAASVAAFIDRVEAAKAERAESLRFRRVEGSDP